MRSQEIRQLKSQLASALAALDECESALREEVDQESADEVRQHPILAKHKRVADRAHRLLKKHGRRS